MQTELEIKTHKDKDKIISLESEKLILRNEKDQIMNQLEEMQNLNNNLMTQLENSNVFIEIIQDYINILDIQYQK